jgi:kojibiose phosphorylase
LDVYEQFEGYFERERINVSAYSPRAANLDMVLGHKRTNASQVIKQADVIMLIALLGKALGDHEELLRNWHAYVPNTAHDSSLSPAIHAWVGAQLGLIDEAYEFWMKSAGLDLENNKGNVRDGIHAAACGGLYQAIVFGFCGLHLDENGDWHTRPYLPRWWKSIRFTLYHHGQKHRVLVTNLAETSQG